ncbi:MAG: flagellar export chaperone FliS [Deltaproteobacteria bacterium]|nr:flagellar export chaperone FliS [Deltaproteobacteria bacterium]
MQPKQHVQQYLKQSIEGVGQGDLIVLLYDAGITFLNTGKLKIGENDIEGAHNALVKAVNVVRELTASLNTEKGGEIAKNLLSLYAFINRRIVEANAKKDATGIDEALVLMTQLRETWSKAVRMHQANGNGVKNGKHSAPVQAGEKQEPSAKSISIRG